MVITCEKDCSMDDQVRGYRGIRAPDDRECGCQTVNYSLSTVN